MIKVEKIEYIVLFLFAINFVNMESRLIFLLFLISVIWVNKCKIPKNRNIFILIGFSSVFYILSSIYHMEMLTYYILPYLLAPTMGYIVGYQLMSYNSYNSDLQLKRIFYILIFGRFFHGLLNFIVSNGYENIVRNGNDVWTKSIIAATGQGALMTMTISLLYFGIFVVPQKRYIEKTFILISVWLCVLNNLKSASRTGIIIMIVIFILCIIYTVLGAKYSSRKKFTIIGTLIVVLALGFLVYNNDFGGIKTNFENSALYSRVNNPVDYESGDENRKNMYLDAIRIGFTKPFGDGTLDTAHNFWLDIFKQTGFIPFLLALIYTINIIRDIWFIIKNHFVNEEIKYLILSVCTAVLINFAVEPIMKGMPYYFTVFCIMEGAMRKYVNRIKGRCINNE